MTIRKVRSIVGEAPWVTLIFDRKFFKGEFFADLLKMPRVKFITLAKENGKNDKGTELLSDGNPVPLTPPYYGAIIYQESQEPSPTCPDYFALDLADIFLYFFNG